MPSRRGLLVFREGVIWAGALGAMVVLAGGDVGLAVALGVLLGCASGFLQGSWPGTEFDPASISLVNLTITSLLVALSAVMPGHDPGLSVVLGGGVGAALFSNMAAALDRAQLDLSVVQVDAFAYSHLPPSAPTLAGRIGRRLVDVVIASVLLVVFAPLLLLVAVAVRLTSAGPVLFRQERLGLTGKPFVLLKFRSLTVGAAELLRADAEAFDEYRRNGFKRAPGTSVVTPVGRILRATSLDEAPQFLNVLRGQMSIIGPRPVVPDELYEYGTHAQHYVAVKPGMTGVWQVSGRSNIEYPDRAGYDAFYAVRRSWLLDMYVLVRTVPAVLSRRGAH